MAPMTPLNWILFGLVSAALVFFLVRYLQSTAVSLTGTIGRILFVAGMSAFAWVGVRTLGVNGRLGSLFVTLLYVFVGVVVQFFLGLVLALLTSQDLRGRRFFRVVFLLPMMITPVGVAYMFRMITDTGKGPLKPLWLSLGLVDFSWVTDPWGARLAIILADTWQWVPFMFIVLLAALESQQVDVMEAATVDGANPWQIFRNITWPAILPIGLTLILIRLIEAFKIIDLPNIMTNGGPGTATESLTLHAFISWRSFDLGNSAALAYRRHTLQRLFSTFPRGGPGVGLLLLRLALGTAALVQAKLYLIDPSHTTLGAWIGGLLAALGGALIVVGFLTPLASALIALGSAGIVFAWFPAPMMNIIDTLLAGGFVIVMSVAIAFLGPGAFSVDCRLFGRREIVIPYPSRPAKP
jgi:ABC-type sugar transport system permease subunit/uncharacterized membrane protein YphA (DoxX/SURF4 family)